MAATRVGYSGGTKLRPSYYDLGDHSEAIEIWYDPARVTYEQLLDRFWEMHDPTLAVAKVQYRSAIFPHDAAQRAAAEQSRDRLAAKLGRKIATAIEDATAFTPAEDYHQKWYFQRSHELKKELAALVGGDRALFDSTLGARLNAYFGNHVEHGAVRAELAALGIPAADADRMMERIRASAGDR